MVFALFKLFSVCLEGVPSSGDHFLSSEDAVGWSRRLGNDFVTIFDAFWHPFGISWGSLLRAFGRQKLQIGRQDSFLADFLGASKQVPKKHPKVHKNRQFGEVGDMAEIE